MQNGFDHHSPHKHDPTRLRISPPIDLETDRESKPIPSPPLGVKDVSLIKSEEPLNGIADDGGPPSKRRRLDESVLLKRPPSRAVSPPWKKIAAEGPTSFMDEGKRRSARTNLVPLELRPQSGKRQTRASNNQQVSNTKSKYTGVKGVHSSPAVSQTKSTQQQASSKRTKLGGRHSLPSSRSIINPQATPVTPTKNSSKRTSLRQSSRRKPSPSPPASPNAIRSRSDGRPRRATGDNLVGQRMSGRWSKREVSIKDESVDDVGSDSEDEDEDEDLSSEDADVDFTVDPNITPQRLNLKVRLPQVKPHHPMHIPASKKHASFRDWVESGASDDGQTIHMTDAQIRQEARIRLQLMEALSSGSKLSSTSEMEAPDLADEPVALYHHKYLLGHAVNMRNLMDKEKRRHRIWAQKICAGIHEYWAMARPKTKAEIEEEEATQWKAYYQAIVRQCCSDINEKYAILRTELDNHRFKLWQQEEEIRNHAAMMNVAEEKRKRVELRVRRDSSAGIGEDSDVTGDSNSELADSEGEISESGDSNMSIDSDERDHESEEELDADQDLSPEQLRRKYGASVQDPTVDTLRDTEADKPKLSLKDGDITQASSAGADFETMGDERTADASDVHTQRTQREGSYQELDDTQLDETDESTDMDDDMGDSDDDSASDDTGGSSEASDEDPNASYLSLFSVDELEKAKAQAALKDADAEDIADETFTVSPVQESRSSESRNLGDIETEKEAISPKVEKIDGEDHIEDSPPLLEITQVQTPPASNSEAPSVHVSNDEEISECAAPTIEPDTERLQESTKNVNGTDVDTAEPVTSLPATPLSSARIKTPVPSLLRGTLREYQHQGLDWLVGLYENEDNGILADEMGLGKTVQTIALLAHLAEKYGQWGPHLIVVPTSVMLNWEMEFKKFLPGFKVLTYYGTQEERKQKRKGWLDDTKWNAVITSYQLVLKDEVSFKKRGWHYLVLDEAHNIKNFKSQRWQTLLTFKTAARLLLTGTPLQNNLAELWSLMFFLMPSEESDTGVQGFTDLDKFTAWFKKPVDQIMEQGRGTMDKEAQDLVRALHQILRPYLLRRLKADVEKQMPAKHEHVVYCKLSKRQRYLYDGFMTRTDTRQQLASGNYLSIINCLMQLRKVCNHPDLFEERPIVTSFALKKPAIADYEIKELLVRRRLLREHDDRHVSLDVIDLLPGSNGPVSALATLQNSRIEGIKRMREVATRHTDRAQLDMSFSGARVEDTLAMMGKEQRVAVRETLHHLAYLTSLRSQRRPLMNYSLIDKVKFELKPMALRERPVRRTQLSRWLAGQSTAMEDMVLDLPRRFETLKSTIQRFSVITPVATLRQDHISELYLTETGKTTVQSARLSYSQDNFHESRMRLSIAFPDKRLLQYDCGKLQRLATLLRDLQSGGHRALIFTQMTKVLDVLERFLNIHGHRYLRLDGSTKVEQRQILTERFNNDSRIPVFILSSRSGGLGINLTGADTVIFYDLDWNPAMDKQCQDRCHRIGQTRDVHIYRFVSEYTIEANILRKANQKRLLDDVIIQDGEFTTDSFKAPTNPRDGDKGEAMHEQDAEASAAMDRILGTAPSGSGGAANTDTASAGNDGASTRILAQADDDEDRKAALIAEKEAQYTEDPKEFEDPEDPSSLAAKGSSAAGAAALRAGTAANDEAVRREREARERERDEGGPPSDISAEVLRGVRQPRSELELDVFAGSGREAVGVDMYMLRLLQWEMRDVPLGPPAGFEKSKKAAHKLARKR